MSGATIALATPYEPPDELLLEGVVGNAAIAQAHLRPQDVSATVRET